MAISDMIVSATFDQEATEAHLLQMGLGESPMDTPAVYDGKPHQKGNLLIW